MCASQYFYVDDNKFDLIATFLESLEWIKTPTTDTADLLWSNLKNISFEEVSSHQIVNHIKGSHNLSNKAMLAYHMDLDGSGSSYLPLNWSSAFQDLTNLIAKVFLNSVYCCLKQFTACESQQYCTATKELLEAKEVLRILNLDNSESKQDLNYVSLCSDMLSCVLPNHTVDVQRARRELASVESAQPWRVQWGGTADLWIVKPVGLSCGEQIEVVSGVMGVMRSVERLQYKCVVQKYIERPLLVRQNRKFDIRQWVVLTNVDPLVVYGFSECYLRLSSQEYSLAAESLRDAKVHLCNHAIQKQSVEADTQSNLNSESELLDVHCDTMMTQAQFCQELLDMAVPGWAHCSDPFTEYVQPKIKAACVAAINSCKHKLQRVGKGFEWLGMDLMVVLEGSDVEVLLLEVNVSPDISLSTPVTSRLVRRAVEDLFSLLLDEGALDGPDAITDAPLRLAAASTDLTTCLHNHDKAPRWEIWHTLQNSILESNTIKFGKHSQRGELPRLRDHAPRKLDVWQSVAKALVRGEKGPSAEVDNSEEDDDEI